VRIEVYDIAGRQVTRLADRQFAAGEVSVTWDGKDASGGPVPAGTYLIRKESQDGVAARKAALIR
jgi:flagellar hook assembly protein FlgD